MDKLDNGRQLVMLGLNASKHAARKQYQSGSQALATTINDVLANRIDERNFRVQRAPYDGIDRLHIVRNMRLNIVEIHLPDQFKVIIILTQAARVHLAI